MIFITFVLVVIAILLIVIMPVLVMMHFRKEVKKLNLDQQLQVQPEP